LLLVVVVLLSGPGGAALVAALVSGTGLTYASGLELRIEERVAYGAVLGPVVCSLITFVLALAAGLTAPVVLAGLGLTLAAGAGGWVYGRRRVRAEVGDALARWRKAEPLLLWVLLAVCWAATLTLMSHAYQETPAGLVTGSVGVYADWAAHLTYAGSFAYGANFPPEFPIHPGHPMTYPFMIDFWAATLVPLTTSLPSSLVLTSGMLGLALPAVLYFAALRLLGSRLAAVMVAPIFTLGGGLGFLLLFRPGGLQLPLLTQIPELNLQWLNPLLAWILPQRSVLFGYALVPLGLALLWTARTGRSWLPYVFAGVVTGVAPLFHLHAFGTLLAMGAMWTAIERRRQWIGFLVPALVLGGPIAWWMTTGGAASVHVELGWLAASGGHSDNWVWFWIWNTGFFAPLLLAAMLWQGTLPSGLGLRLAPIWLWFLVPNVLVLQPWDWDNTKFFAYWALIGAIGVAALLARIGRMAPPLGAAITVVLLAVLTVSGGVDVWNATWGRDQRALFTDAGGVRAAAWVRSNTDRKAIFVVAPVHNEPIPCLSGRRVMDGYPGWLWTYGFSDWQQRTDDAQRILQGGAGAGGLVRRYNVDYVVIGPQELSSARASAAYWNSAARVVYRDEGYTIYRTAAH
jgi:hypothetical protein